MMHDYQTCFSSLGFQSHLIAAITNEWNTLKLKIEYLKNNPTFIDDPEQLQHHLHELISHLTTINQELPGLPKEKEILSDSEGSEF